MRRSPSAGGAARPHRHEAPAGIAATMPAMADSRRAAPERHQFRRHLAATLGGLLAGAGAPALAATADALLWPALALLLLSTLTHLGRGDTAGLIAALPVLLLLQMALLPAYLWLCLGAGALGTLPAGRLLPAFAMLIAAPLAMAWLMERSAEGQPAGAGLLRAMGAAPVPLLAVVVVLRSLVELLGMLPFLRLLPRLFPGVRG